MNVLMVNLVNPNSIAVHCEKRVNLKAANEEMQKHNPDCLSAANRDRYDGLVREGKYIEVMGAIWKDKANRLSFLESHAAELHAPLMFEEAIACFMANPTIETLFHRSLPLLNAAGFRMSQDVQCSMDPSVLEGDQALRMYYCYKNCLDGHVQKLLNRSAYTKDEKEQAEIDTWVLQKVDEVAKRSMEIALPSPTYVAAHGLKSLLNQGDSMHPQSEHKKLRDAYAQKMLQKRGQTEEKEGLKPAGQ